MKQLISFFILFCIANTNLIAQEDKPSFPDPIFLTYYDSLTALEKVNKYEAAIAICQQAKQISLNKYGEDTVTVYFINNIARIHQLLNQLDKAKKYYHQSLDISKRNFGEQHYKTAVAYHNLGLLYYKMEDRNGAVKMLEQSKSIFSYKKEEYAEKYGQICNTLATMYYRLGWQYETEATFLEARNYYAKSIGTEHPQYGSLLINLAAFYIDNNAYEEAGKMMEEAARIYLRIKGRESYYYAVIINNVGYLLFKQERYAEAEKAYSEALEIKEKIFGKEHPTYAETVHNLAALYFETNRIDKAIEYYQKSLKLTEKTKGKDNVDYANGLNLLGKAYYELKEYEKAEELLQEALKIKEKFLGKDHGGYFISLRDLLLLYVKVGKYENAEQSFLELSSLITGLELDKIDKVTSNQIEEVLQDLSPSRSRSLVKALRAGYDLYAKHNDQDKTKRTLIADLAQRILSKQRSDLISESDKLRLLKSSNDWVHRALALREPNQTFDYVFDIAEQNKSVLLLEASKSEKAYRIGGLPDSIATEEQELYQNKNKLMIGLLKATEKEVKDSLTSLLNITNQSLNELKNAIRDDFPTYFNAKFYFSLAKTKEIQSKLPSDAALLEYALGDSAIYIFYIDKNGTNWARVDIEKEDISKRIAVYRKTLSDVMHITNVQTNSDEELVENGYWFYQKLIGPVLQNKTTIEQLIIITDGELGHLPFEVFLTEEAKIDNDKQYGQLPYLIKKYAVSYNYSATWWSESQEKDQNIKSNGELLALAAEYKNIDSTKVRHRLSNLLAMRGGLVDLPAAQEEVKYLANNFNGYFGIGATATEKIFKQKADDNYAIMHLAVHGLLDKEKPLLSSLVLSEDGDSLENNFLQAYEISQMKLNTNLVVLSACETGYGKFETGNGVASLARSFMYAGVPSIIVSLWPVNDQSTGLIMERFYSYLSHGEQKSIALQKAKLDYMKQSQQLSSHPVFWSPFVIMGNTNPVQIKTQGSLLLWLGGGILTLGLLLLGVRLSRSSKT